MNDAGGCRLCGEPGRKINLLVRTSFRTTRGAGVTFLCEACWRRLTDGLPRRGGSPARPVPHG